MGLGVAPGAEVPVGLGVAPGVAPGVARGVLFGVAGVAVALPSVLVGPLPLPLPPPQLDNKNASGKAAVRRAPADVKENCFIEFHFKQDDCLCQYN